MVETGMSAHLASTTLKIYEGLTEENPWQGLLKHLRQITETEVAAITLSCGNRISPPLIIWDRDSPLSVSQIRQAQLDHALLIESDPLSTMLRHSGDIYTLDEIISHEKLIKTPFYEKLMKPYGIRFQVGMCFKEPNGWTCNIGLMRTAVQPAFDATDKEFLLLLRPHLENALAIYAQLQRSKTERSIFEDSLCRLGVGVLILNKDKQIIGINATAKKICRQPLGIKPVNGRLVLTKEKAAMDEAIAAALEASNHSTPESFAQAIKLSSARLGDSESYALGALIRSVDTTHKLYQGDEAPRVVIYLSNHLQDNIVAERMIEGLFGLTHTEAILALLLCNGFTLSQAAQKLDVAENTTRVYSKRIFSKVGVCRQAELVRVILKSVAFLA